MIGAHVNATLFEFVNHLIEAFESHILAHGPVDPGDIIIALVWRPVVKIGANGILFERQFYVGRHLIELSAKIALFVSRFGVLQTVLEFIGLVAGRR